MADRVSTLVVRATAAYENRVYWSGFLLSFAFERDPKESVHTAHLREMLESFAATFSLSDTFSQRLNRKAWANLSAVLKAVGNRFGHAVDANGHAINSRVGHVLGQGMARKPD